MQSTTQEPRQSVDTGMLTIRSPFSGDVVGEVPDSTPSQIETFLANAARAARVMARLTPAERYELLMRAANLLQAEVEKLARTVTLEMGKPISEARVETTRIIELLRLCAFEGAQLRGEQLPVEAQAGARGKLGFTIPMPVGVVVAITPFNYPLLLVMHKIGPALAAGNAVLLKPATQTSLSALRLCEIMNQAGLPEGALQCVTGAGGRVGEQLCRDERVRKISFTGSTGVGRRITEVAGVKKFSLELGSNAPLIIMSDADLEQVANATTVGGYVNAGQVCISVQRVFVQRPVYADFLAELKPRVEAIPMGDPLREESKLGSLVSQREAERVASWITEAGEQGARILTGGERAAAVVQPAIIADARPEMRVMREELFGPAIAVMPFDSIDDAIALANDSRYGLGAGIFTRDITKGLRFAREVESGMVQVNWTPLWRADLMPYGGVKESGIGREGPRYAIQEMTEFKSVVIHGLEN